jgi:multiple sugar transport system ATP-binding protein
VGTPYEIYNDPVSHFVADFMGSPGMNFIECIVKDQNLIIDSGGEKYELSIPCKDALNNSNLDVVLLGIRPEMLTEIQPLVADNSFVQQIKFDVEVLEPMGADTVAIGQWNENEVMARLSPESGNTAGKGFDLQVDTSKAILFDPNTGLRIR